MEQQKFSLGKRAKSFKYAFDGLKLLLRNEHNSRIHLFVAVMRCCCRFRLAGETRGDKVGKRSGCSRCFSRSSYRSDYFYS